jgi:hypothetical protein
MIYAMQRCEDRLADRWSLVVDLDKVIGRWGPMNGNVIDDAVPPEMYAWMTRRKVA